MVILTWNGKIPSYIWETERAPQKNESLLFFPSYKILFQALHLIFSRKIFFFLEPGKDFFFFAVNTYSVMKK